MPDNPLQIPAQSSSDNNTSNAEIMANSTTSGNDSNKSATINKTSGQMKSELKQAIHNIRVWTVYLIFGIGIILVIYASCVYLNNTDGALRLEHLYAVIDYLKVHGMPSTIVGLLVWAFVKK